MAKSFSDYQVARMELIRTAKRAKRIYPHDKPAVRQIINDRVDSLSREHNLTEHKRVINNRIVFMFRVFSNEHIQIIYRNAIGACECTVAYLNREEFKNVVEGTITEWNNIVTGKQIGRAHV